jgi:hypothetical protein
MVELVPENVHLVGSIGLDTVDEVFRTVGSLLGRRLKRVPDGEVGGRRLWISWQYPLLRASPFLRADPGGAKRPTTGFPLLCLGEGVAGDDVRFGELGYAREARASYLDFQSARARGELPAAARFQVCLPTPLAVTSSFCMPADWEAIERAYERAMLRELDTLCRTIPQADLAVQWDVCNEMVLWDGQAPRTVSPSDFSRDDMLDRLERIAAAVPPAAELGIHLCYGDYGGRHMVEPKDAGKMVEFANAIAKLMVRRLDFLHMPVPANRTDEDFYRPFADLNLSPDTEIYLGLVHADGPEAVESRMAVARRYVPGFGIATECGMARARTPNFVRNLLGIHAAVSREPAPGPGRA